MKPDKSKALIEDLGLETFDRNLKRLQEDVSGFQLLAGRLEGLTGVSLPPNPKNIALMASRLSKAFKLYGVSSYREYLALLDHGEPEITKEFISSLTTHTTHFFREEAHFKFLADSLARLIEKKRSQGVQEIRVWCAAASTGQEPYTILMTVLDALAAHPYWSLKFLATDIDLAALKVAASGVYTDLEIEKLAPQFRSRFFSIKFENGKKFYQLKSEYRKMIRFARFNLVEAKYPFQFQFDVIFCRNVLIYFNQTVAGEVVEKLAKQLSKDGMLFVGHSECGFVRTKLLKSVAAGVYRRMIG